jgi:hypothetical protein
LLISLGAAALFEGKRDCIVYLKMRADNLLRHFISGELTTVGGKHNDDPAAKSKLPTISGVVLFLSALGIYPKILEVFLMLKGYNHAIGHHYFENRNGTSTPVLALDQLPQDPYPMAKVSRIDGADTPQSAYSGLHQEGAIPWLHLADTYDLSYGGINTVISSRNRWRPRPT